ncbi:MAG: DUF1062 domain-containing protein [Defluviitaleaceae bacterium]|nr:DUF1062 domain-containing protein [Defluviitaleaceae bacterium]
MRCEKTVRIVPENAPAIIRHCGKCNKNMKFVCSNKFRVNSNGARSDIWLIYKCEKCDSTWKLPISKGIKPGDSENFDRFICNDPDLAREYAFNRGFLKQQSCVVDCADVKYTVECAPDGAVADAVEYTLEGAKNLTLPVLLHVESVFTFDLKLSKFLADLFGISVGRVKKLAQCGAIYTVPECDPAKHKIRGNIDVFVQQI